MTSTEERMKILEMLEQEKISATDAAALLRALDGSRRPVRMAAASEGGPRFLRVRVTDMETGAAKVNVTVPYAMISAGLRIAERFAPELEGFDMEELDRMISDGSAGKIMEVEDAEDNERVQIYLE